MSAKTQLVSLCKGTTLYQEFLAELEEINRHKWLESEKRGYDVGFDWALMDWVSRFRRGWLRAREKTRAAQALIQGQMI